MFRCRLIVITALLLIFMAAAPAGAFVNPNFTPANVYTQYDLICTVTGQVAKDGRSVTLSVGDVVKGKKPGEPFTLDLADALAGKNEAESAARLVELLGRSPRPPVMLFLPGPDAQVPSALIHADVHWYRATPARQGARLTFEKFDSWLNGTFNGSTDMLIATMGFIARKSNRPIMPVDIGVKWDAHTKAGKLPGKAVAIKALDINGDGKLDIYAACSEGDRVFLAGKDNGFEELPGLDAKSVAADWADFDGDGRPDLASLSPAGLTLYLQTTPGKFKATQIELRDKPNAASPTVSSADLDGDGKSDIVLGSSFWPIMLHNDGQGAFKSLPPPATTQPAAPGNQVGPCIVADFDSDGRPDILQTYDKGGLLLRGGRNAFEPCDVAMGDVKHRTATLADLAGDGHVCVILSGGGTKPVIYAWADGRFRSVTGAVGEPSYIMQAGVSCIAAGDMNNDTFVDLFVGYAAEPAQCFFNRGCRSLAIAESLKLPDDDMPGAKEGQAAAALADLDGDGSLELVVALANGDVWASMTTLGAMVQPRAIAARIADKCPAAPPVDVSFWLDNQCLGLRRIDNRFAPALMGLPVGGQVTLKYRLPGAKEESSTTVKVSDDAVKVDVAK
jgi:hypothetical protein